MTAKEEKSSKCGVKPEACKQTENYESEEGVNTSLPLSENGREVMR